MSRVITFSRVYPSYHPRDGEPTYFVEKILKSLKIGYDYCVHEHSTHSFWSLNRGKEKLVDDFIKFNFSDPFDYQPKHHTIRAGHRWKAGDWFSPRVWSGKPYNSKQIQFAPDIQVKKTWDFEVIGTANPFYLGVRVAGLLYYEIQCYQAFLGGLNKLEIIAANDGLEWEDFQDWFKFGETIKFKGQVICWDENIEY